MNRFAIKLLAVCVLYALCVGYVFADEWTGKDKQLHFVGGAAIAAAVTAATRDEWAGFAAGTASGLLKEVYDSTGRGQVSGKDFAVTALGALIGAKGAGWVITRNSVVYTRRINIF
jgi:uncharacterized protein YfiM (DUF2279 family)